jgi:hypothetical protein
VKRFFRKRGKANCPYCHRLHSWKRQGTGQTYIAVDDDGRLHDCPQRRAAEVAPLAELVR